MASRQCRKFVAVDERIVVLIYCVIYCTCLTLKFNNRCYSLRQRKEPLPRAAVVAQAAAAAVDEAEPTWFDTYIRVAGALTNLFPVWTVVFTLWALKDPSAFAWLTTKYFTAGLAILMLSMGITLAPKDFQRVATRPNAVLLNFALCYGTAPAS